MDNPLVSVIIPMYNAEKTIETSINSIFNQTYKDYEIIIINDGSKDKSKEIVEKIINNNKDKKILLINKENGGVSSARNFGIKNANGEYIAFLDSDDEWLPEKLEKQADILIKNKEIDFIGCNRNNEKTSVLLKKFDRLKKIEFNDILLKMFPQTSTAVIKKNVFNEIGFYDEKQRYLEDGNLWLRIIAKKNCYMMPESLVLTGGGKPNFGFSGLSSKLWDMEKGEIKNINEMYKMGYINGIIKNILLFYSLFKYLRRYIIVKLLRRKKK